MSWTWVLLPALKLGGVGLTFGALIALAHRYLKVWVDPRIEAVRTLLPGSDCGACGQPGCAAFAEALVAGEAEPARCTNISPEEAADVAGYLGGEAGTAQRLVARLLCAGGVAAARQHARYRGLPTCAAAAAVASGGKGCTWGCLGLADCEVACTFDAIAMNAQRLPVVAPARCTACGDCVDVCPKDLFTLLPAEQKLVVQCKSELLGELAEELCSVACTGCGKCAQDAPPGVIAIENGLAIVATERHAEAGWQATTRCPTGAIAWVDDTQFAEAT